LRGQIESHLWLGVEVQPNQRSCIVKHGFQSRWCNQILRIRIHLLHVGITGTPNLERLETLCNAQWHERKLWAAQSQMLKLCILSCLDGCITRSSKVRCVRQEAHIQEQARQRGRSAAH